jgi:hypothetical protein
LIGHAAKFQAVLQRAEGAFHSALGLRNIGTDDSPFSSAKARPNWVIAAGSILAVHPEMLCLSL